MGSDIADLKTRPLVTSSATIRNAKFSPNGKWVAYSLNETASGKSQAAAEPSPDGAVTARNCSSLPPTED